MNARPLHNLEILRVAEKTNCAPPAIDFVLRTISQLQTTQEKTNLDARTLCWQIHNQAVIEFNVMAKEQLNIWGIFSTRDIGQVVLELKKACLVENANFPDPEDFDNVFDFEMEFGRFKNRYKIPSLAFKWSLAALFLMTTVFAIALPGVVAGGATGAVGTLVSSWLVIAGACCIWMNLRDRSAGLELLTIGMAFVLLGVTMFFLFSRQSP